MKKFTNVIFDFDGTLANTLMTVIRLINKDPKRYGIDGIDESEIQKFRNLSIPYLMREFNISVFRLPTLLLQIQADLSKKIDTIELFLRMEMILKKLRDEHYVVGIVTSNSEQNVLAVLLKYGLDSLPSFVHGGRSLFGKHMKIKRAMEKHSLDPAKTIYIGDEVRDIVTARKAGVASGVVTWGYNTKELLLKHNPDYVIDIPEEILDIVSGKVDPKFHE